MSLCRNLELRGVCAREVVSAAEFAPAWTAAARHYGSVLVLQGPHLGLRVPPQARPYLEAPADVRPRRSGSAGVSSVYMAQS